MNFQKIAMTATTAGIMLASAVPAFASWNVGALNGNIAQVNSGAVVNNVTTSTNTGKNLNLAFVAGAQLTQTGTAVSGANVQTQLNVNQISCGCVTNNVNLGVGNGNTIQANHGMVMNTVTTSANTGMNANVGGAVLLQGVNTGAATSGSVVTNIVNTNVIGVVTP